MMPGAPSTVHRNAPAERAMPGDGTPSRVAAHAATDTDCGIPGRSAMRPAPKADAGPASATRAPEHVGFVSSLSRTLAAANGFILQQLARCGLQGIATSHGDILSKLFADGPVSMQELASAIGRDPSTVTSLVRKLAAAGYVETGKSAADRRVTEVSLTPAGRRLEGDFTRISAELQAVQMRGIDPEDFAITCRTLRQIRDNFTEVTEQEKR